MRWVRRMLPAVLVAELLLGVGCSNKKASDAGERPIPTYPPGKGADKGGKSGVALPPK